METLAMHDPLMADSVPGPDGLYWWLIEYAPYIETTALVTLVMIALVIRAKIRSIYEEAHYVSSLLTWRLDQQGARIRKRLRTTRGRCDVYCSPTRRVPPL